MENDNAPNPTHPEILTLAMVVDAAAARALRLLCGAERRARERPSEPPRCRRARKAA